MSRFLLLACLSLLAGCLSPPGATVAATGPSEFLLEGSIVLSAGEFSMENRPREQAPRCPGCLRWCADDGLQSRPWDPELPDDCSELAFLVDWVQRSGGDVTASAGLGVGIGFAEADSGAIEFVLFDFGAVAAQDIAPGNDGWSTAATGSFGGDPEDFFVNSFTADNGSVDVCWSAPLATGELPAESCL